ncbi:MAG TPA: hypothetical protein VJB59_13615 [Bdellovibrionota bacterium]|nr:hypothetical protein [Bdellovibrionota bacterium]
MKSRLVIFDADVIIGAFATNLWDSLVDRFDIRVTSIVLHSEVFFFENKDGTRVSIDLKSYVARGKVTELSASAEEIAALTDKVNPNLLNRIDDGEQEALALLLTGRFDDHLFCTKDTRAIKALGSLSLGAFGISLEELLAQIGMRNKIPDPSYSKSAFELKKAQGLQEQAMFLRKKS